MKTQTEQLHLITLLVANLAKSDALYNANVHISHLADPVGPDIAIKDDPELLELYMTVYRQEYENYTKDLK